MNNIDRVGLYLGRSIQLAQVTKENIVSLCEELETSSSMVLFFMCSTPMQSEISFLIAKLVETKPLVIALAGLEADKVFNNLLGYVSVQSHTKHIMTDVYKQLEFSEIAIDFLSATWPAEDRFHEWDTYTILTVGCNASCYSRIIADLKKLGD